MYSCSRYIVVHFIWLAFIFIFDPHGQALSDISFLSNDILAADDVGSDFILPELNQYSPLDELWRTSDSDQSLDLTDLLSDDDAATDDHRLFDASGLDDSFFDDNLLVADAQSCLQQPSGGKKLKARRDSQQNSCANPSSIFNPSISIPPPGLTDDDDDYTPEDERVRQIEEVKKYWCGDNPNPNGRTFWAVCSLDPYAHLIEGQLRSYFRPSLTFSLSPLPILLTKLKTSVVACC